ncbi:hypothetical protein [Demequina globuliformis]|uniref:hypothetical protein n=1 Tax=Demequina globuliformis TaxID=676202 RepID=UPI0007839DD2|nr:hypothetical protein [Demequina globuliformis]
MKRDVLITFALFAFAFGLTVAGLFTDGGASAWLHIAAIVLAALALCWSWLQALGEADRQRLRANHYLRTTRTQAREYNQLRAFTVALGASMHEERKS